MGKNWDWSYQRGIERRLEVEEQAYRAGIEPPKAIPLHSHCATMQSYFNRGWNSVTPVDIRLHLGLVKAPTSHSPLDKLKEIKACHF